ncbi:hypothetical protein QFC20_001190 [Naganishia adeliensis]|uniref:Uncharacterized protein n=1 Tax=Naganishia adeliensis TaxID=92952 RepID=A0ACC2WSR7_9TREE|nr:hypothetical protein QFC20_001190 [Naganishia adeliensis]
MHDLISRVQALHTVTQDDATATITQEDVVRSVKLLKPLNAGYEIHSIPPSRDLFIRSVPSELDSDTITLLGLASSLGHLGEPAVIKATGWSDTRTRAAFEKMVVRDGVAWVDEQAAEQGGGMEIWRKSSPSLDPCRIATKVGSATNQEEHWITKKSVLGHLLMRTSKSICDRCGVDHLFLAMGTSDPQGSSKFEPDTDDRVANRFTHGPGQFSAMFRAHRSPTQLFIALHVPG